MNQTIHKLAQSAGFLMAFLIGLPLPAQAAIDGINGGTSTTQTFNLTAKPGYISTGDGNSVYVWGYANGTGAMQYPGPTLIVKQGDKVVVNLSNNLPAGVSTSIIFPGQSQVDATGGNAAGLVTKEVNPGNSTVTYTFTATEPGTYMYHSGTNQALQLDMGLVGTLIVRPKVADPLHQAYTHSGSAFTHEYLFLLSEMDPAFHAKVESDVLAGLTPSVDNLQHLSTLWFINGRNGPDTMLDGKVSWLPNQPYNALARMHPGEKLLMRVINVGRDLHPFHTHGNNMLMIARDGRMLASSSSSGPDLATSNYTLQAVPGETYDLIYQWTGAGLNWDIYGHLPDANGNLPPLEPFESEADHGKPFPQISPGVPLALPNILDRFEGEGFSGSPFLGASESARPGQVKLNRFGGYFHMWHSHAERELTNDDIFPGGMLTMVIIEPHGVPIP